MEQGQHRVEPPAWQYSAVRQHPPAVRDGFQRDGDGAVGGQAEELMVSVFSEHTGI